MILTSAVNEHLCAYEEYEPVSLQSAVEWVHPPASLAHPFDDGSMAMLERSVVDTGKSLGPDAEVYRNGKMDS